MNRKIALFLFAIGLAASAGAAHMDDFACREYCALEYKTCKDEGRSGCEIIERTCYSECIHL